MRARGTRVAGTRLTRWQRIRSVPLRAVLVALPLIIGLVAGVGSASALTLGVGWSGDSGLNEPEMLQVGRSGAGTFRVPMAPENNNDGVVKAAAENGVTIHAGIGGNGPLPSGSSRTT